MKWLKEFADEIFTIAILIICFVVIPTCYVLLIVLIKLIERL
jgi:hypothetical protein